MTDAPFTVDLLARAEEVGLNASVPPQQRLVDGWLLRFSPGKAKRARSIQAISAGRLSLPDKLALCREVYAAAGLPMLLRITPFCAPAGLDAALERVGMRTLDDTRVMLRDGLTLRRAKPLPDRVEIAPLGLVEYAELIGQLRGSSSSQRQAHAQRLLNAPVPFFPRVLTLDGEVAACGQFALEGQFAGLYDVFTAPRHRGQGLARRLCEQLLGEAASRGARIAYLQVEGDNRPARAVYHRLGFADGYAYHYRTPDPDAV